MPLFGSSYGKLEESDFPFVDCLTEIEMSIMAYQLFAQSVLWPLDPWYETSGNDKNRVAQMGHVRTFLEKNAWLKNVRGPGIAMDFLSDDTGRLDPVLSYYEGRLKPWQRACQFDGSQYVVFEPNKILGYQVESTKIAYYTKDCSQVFGITPPDHILQYGVEVKKVATNPNAKGTNKLVAFEGGHGFSASHSDGAAIWSMMGFVYREELKKGHDIHIVFRGSRSGKAGRAMKQALLKNSGNADWVTDMDNSALIKHPFISEDYAVGRGFGSALVSGLPTLLAALHEIDDGTAPSAVHVTGHSLGGALATVLGFSILFGEYGKILKKDKKLKSWPWAKLQVYTFSAPTAVSKEAAKLIKKHHKPDTGFRFERVKVKKDPITTFHQCKHAGRKCTLPAPSWGVLQFSRHEPMQVHESLIKKLGKDYEVDRIPKLMKTYKSYKSLPFNAISDVLPDPPHSFLSLFNCYLVSKGSVLGTNDSLGWIGNSYDDVKVDLVKEAEKLGIKTDKPKTLPMTANPWLVGLCMFSSKIVWSAEMLDWKVSNSKVDEWEDWEESEDEEDSPSSFFGTEKPKKKKPVSEPPSSFF